jgi:alpha-D-xyloside xylohydrolase
MLGGDLLVAPVFTAAGDVSYYVPAGRWTHLLEGRAGGQVIEGPRWVREQHGFDSVPVLARPGSVIAMGRRDDRPDYDYLDGVTLRVYEPRDGARGTTSVPTTKGDVGAAFAVTRAGRELRVERSGAQAHWRVLLVGQHTVSASSGVVTPTPEGALINVDAGIDLTIILLDRN